MKRKPSQQFSGRGFRARFASCRGLRLSARIVLAIFLSLNTATAHVVDRSGVIMTNRLPVDFFEDFELPEPNAADQIVPPVVPERHAPPAVKRVRRTRPTAPVREPRTRPEWSTPPRERPLAGSD